MRYFLISVLILISLPVSAQEQNPDLAELSIEELIKIKVTPFEVSTSKDIGYLASNSISASRIDKPIGELPFAIQAFTLSFIEDQYPRNIFDVAKYSPGVTYKSNDFNEGNANLSIRGFAVGTTPSSGQILRDGFRGASIFDFTNISRVEIVKGPASFLYGQVAPGGIANIITKSPEKEFKANGRVNYGSYDQYRLQADVTGPAIKKVYYRLAASYDQDMHFWDAYDANSTNISPSLLWEIDKKLRATMKYEYFRKRESPQLMQKPGYPSQSGVIPSPSDPNRAGVDVPGLDYKFNSMSNVDFRDSDTHSINTYLDYRVNEIWNFRFGHSRDDYRIDAVFSGNFGMANSTTRIQGRRFRRSIYVNKGDTYQAEANGNYKWDDISLQLLLGAQLIERSFENQSGQAPNDPVLGNDPVATPLPYWDLSDPSTWNRRVGIPLSNLTDAKSNEVITFQDKSVYIGSTLGFFKNRLLILGGLRETITVSKRSDYVANETGPEIEASRTTPQYGLLYKITPAVSFFTSYAESFLPTARILNVRNVPTSTAKPTEGNGYDIGLKTESEDKRISGTLTYFEIRNKNVINDIAVLDPNSGQQVFTNVQSGEQRSRGVELDTTISPTNSWQFYASYSYMDAKITEFSGRDKEILAQDPSTLDPAEQQNYKNVKLFHNAPLPMSARQLANFWSKFYFSEGGRLKNYYVAGGLNFVKDQTILPETPRKYWQNYTLYNALIGRSWKQNSQIWRLELVGKNLSNEEYRPSQSSRSRPREFLLTLIIDL